MDVLYLLIPLSVLLVLIIGVVLWTAVRGGQFEDLDRPAVDLLADDDQASDKPCSGETERHRSR